MTCPRIEVDLAKIRYNMRTVVDQLNARGISVTGVTKAVCGHPVIAQAMLDGGATGLAEARLRNVQRLRKAGITCPITLIRTPMLSQVDDIVQVCDASYNTQLVVVAGLAAAAVRRGRVHGIILMVEMGDLRDGIMPKDLGTMAQQVVELPGVALKGIGANFACLSGVAPDAAKMAAFSLLADKTEGVCGPFLHTVSGGNSANLPWALDRHPVGRINDLRLGEAILLGVDPDSGDQIDGMHTDAFTLIAEVIETDTKPALPTSQLRVVAQGGQNTRLIFAIGHQDTDISGLFMPPGHTFIGATSDHLVLATTNPLLTAGCEMRFQMTYSALMRAMAAPDIDTVLRSNQPLARGMQSTDKRLALV